MDILEGLNPGQLGAVNHKTGPMLVVAGAGTGKTRVITHRIARLIASGEAKPEEILALTFTEKAAREMADRLYDLIGWQSFQVPVLTFNAFGGELLGRFASHIGRSVRGGLINTTQKTLLLQQHFDDISLQYYGPQGNLYEFLTGIVAYIEQLQNAGVTAGRYEEFVSGLKPGEDWNAADILEQRDLLALYQLYEGIKHKTGTYDYSDQLMIPLECLKARPNLAERLAQQYRYVLVDEYQDTSPLQDELLQSFVPPQGNIFAVGDDDQAIYSFRGANIANILNFTDHFQVTNTIVLTENYRSGQPILDAAYRLICHNDPDRLEVKLGLTKQLHGQFDTAETLFTPYQSASDEQSAVIEALAARLASGEDPAQLAVLGRSNALLRSYAKALRERGIPFALSTEINIFEQRELIHLWYLMEWLGHRATPESIAHVVMGPFIGWTAAQYRAVVQREKDGLQAPEEALRSMAAEGDKPAVQLVGLLDEWRGWAAGSHVSQLAYRLVFETGLAERLMEVGQQNGRVVRVFEDLHVFLNQLQDYEVVALDGMLAGYLANFPEPPALEATETIGDAGGVQLLTIHASKGLEFNSVWLVGCTARAWSQHGNGRLEVPAGLALRPDLRPEHEQRRLLYVAATRAKHQLYLSAATNTAGGQNQKVSPLIEELLGSQPAVQLASSKSTDIDKSLQKLQRFYPLKEEINDQKLPFEGHDGWIELGVGALGAYDYCPHEFYLQYVLGISQPFGPQLAFGTSIHGALETYFSGKLRGERVPLAEIQTRLDELWSSQGYETKQLAEAARKRAHEAVASVVAREEAGTVHEILGSELAITLEVPEAKLRLRGRIDAYFQTPEGIEIRDFKTGMKRDPEKLAADAKNSFQLRTYALAYEVMTGAAPAKVTLDYVVTGTIGSAELSARILENHRAKLVKLAESIRARDFAPAPQSQFHTCAAFRYYGDAEDEAAE